MKRHFYISNNLDELESIEVELESNGISKPHIHVLSLDDAGVARHEKLHEVEAVLRTDVVRGTKIGSLVGLFGALIVLLTAYLTGWGQGTIWLPFVFLSIVVIGFCTWEGGFIGIQIQNKRFARFDKELETGNHLFFVDIESEKEQLLSDIMGSHPTLEVAGEGPSVPHWFVRLQERFKHFLKVMP